MRLGALFLFLPVCDRWWCAEPCLAPSAPLLQIWDTMGLNGILWISMEKHNKKLVGGFFYYWWGVFHSSHQGVVKFSHIHASIVFSTANESQVFMKCSNVLLRFYIWERSFRDSTRAATEKRDREMRGSGDGETWPVIGLHN